MKNQIILIAAMITAFVSCGRDDMNIPRGNDVAPAQVTVTKINDLEGASVIYYNRPSDTNLKYVKAVWTTDDGVKMDATASFYTDSIFVEGFGKAGAYEVKLYSVSSSEVSSAPVSTTIHPKTPAYLSAFERLNISPYFLGIRGTTFNPTHAKLSFYTYKKNTAGEWVEIGSYHTVNDTITFSIGGQDTVQAEFGVRLRDRFQHWSDIKTATCTPWWETLCPRTLFRECKITRMNEYGEHVFDNLCTDWEGHDMHMWSTYVSFAALWDGEIMMNSSKSYHSKPSGTHIPQSFCIDLGKAYSLSRFILWPRASSTNMGSSTNYWENVWTNGMPKRIRVYGSSYNGDDPTQLEDNINDRSAWILLAEETLTRADGTTDALPGNVVGTDEDRAKIEKGFEVVLSADAPKIRYFRFQTIEMYGTSPAVMLDEFQFYGSDK